MYNFHSQTKIFVLKRNNHPTAPPLPSPHRAPQARCPGSPTLSPSLPPSLLDALVTSASKRSSICWLCSQLVPGQVLLPLPERAPSRPRKGPSSPKAQVHAPPLPGSPAGHCCLACCHSSFAYGSPGMRFTLPSSLWGRESCPTASPPPPPRPPAPGTWEQVPQQRGFCRVLT